MSKISHTQNSGDFCPTCYERYYEIRMEHLRSLVQEQDNKLSDLVTPVNDIQKEVEAEDRHYESEDTECRSYDSSVFYQEQNSTFTENTAIETSILEQPNFYRNTIRRTSKAYQIIRGRRLKYSKEHYANRRYLKRGRIIQTTEL